MLLRLWSIKFQQHLQIENIMMGDINLTHDISKKISDVKNQVNDLFKDVNNKEEQSSYNLKLINRLTDMIILQIDNKASEICIDFRNRIIYLVSKLKKELFLDHYLFVKKWKNIFDLSEEIDLYDQYFISCTEITKNLTNFYQRIIEMPDWRQTEEQQFEQNILKPILKCQQCEIQFTSLFQINSHIHDNENEGIVCKLCSKQFFNQKSLITHLELRHNKSYDCQKCHNSFVTPMDLWLHNQIAHTNDVYYMENLCKFCKKNNSDKKQLRRHLLLHHVAEINREYKEHLKKLKNQTQYQGYDYNL